MLEPDACHIDIWLVDDREVTDVALLEQYQALLSAVENERLERLLFTRHRHQFLVTRALLRSVLAKYVADDLLEPRADSSPEGLVFESGPQGKPCLPVAPNLEFNLTHTKGLAALAVTRDVPIGLDVEYLSRVADVVRLTERYFAQAEIEALYRLPVNAWNNRFYDLWTLKEAYLKACGTGLQTPLRDFSFAFSEAGIDIHFSEALPDDPANWRFWQMTLAGDYRLSLAAECGTDQAFSLSLRRGIPLQGFSKIALPPLRTDIKHAEQRGLNVR